MAEEISNADEFVRQKNPGLHTHFCQLMLQGFVNQFLVDFAQMHLKNYNDAIKDRGDYLVINGELDIESVFYLYPLENIK